jgi:hypothetical protein
MSIQGPTNYQHPFPNYQLNDLHQAMDYNSAGQPIIRVSTGSTGSGNTIVNGNTGSDAFGRMRVSTPTTLFDSQNRYIPGELFATATSGSGALTYNANGSNFSLTVSGSGDEVIRQCKTVQLYQPGKSLQVLNTFAMATLDPDLRQRVGYFTANNGIYFEADGNDLYLVLRSSVSGSVQENRIAQSDWNQDPLNGTGASGITLDPTKVQIFWLDIEWLGVGSVRTGFVVNGIFYICHVFNHANIETDVYMTTATLNCRYEITSTGGSGTMLQICSTVISEGGYNPLTPVRYVGNGSQEKVMGSADTLEPLASIRLNSAYPDAVVTISSIDFLTVDVAYGEIQLILNATLGNASFANVSNSVVQTDTAANTISGGTVVYSALYASRATVQLSDEIRRRLQLGRDISGNSDVLTLATVSNSNNADVLYSLGWVELSNN